MTVSFAERKFPSMWREITEYASNQDIFFNL